MFMCTFVRLWTSFAYERWIINVDGKNLLEIDETVTLLLWSPAPNLEPNKASRTADDAIAKLLLKKLINNKERLDENKKKWLNKS